MVIEPVLGECGLNGHFSTNSIIHVGATEIDGKPVNIGGDRGDEVCFCELSCL